MSEPQNETVPLDSITTTPVAAPANGAPFQKDVDPFTGRRDWKLDQHLGSIGRLIGGGPEKAGNIASVVVIVALMILLLGSIFLAYTASDKIAGVFDRILSAAVSLITGALGFLFGKSGSSKE